MEKRGIYEKLIIGGLTNKMYKYAIEIFYSEDDEGYIAVVPELPGCSAFGETEKDALKEVMVAMELWLKTAEKEGRKIPTPSITGVGLLEKAMKSVKIPQPTVA